MCDPATGYLKIQSHRPSEHLTVQIYVTCEGGGGPENLVHTHRQKTLAPHGECKNNRQNDALSMIECALVAPRIYFHRGWSPRRNICWLFLGSTSKHCTTVGIHFSFNPPPPVKEKTTSHFLSEQDFQADHQPRSTSLVHKQTCV